MNLQRHFFFLWLATMQPDPRSSMAALLKATSATAVASLLLLCAVTANPTTDPAEVAALIDFYTSTNGPDWEYHDWDTPGTDPCGGMWAGITCSGTSPNHVVYACPRGGCCAGGGALGDELLISGGFALAVSRGAASACGAWI